MPNFVGSVQYRLQGNIFENRYYINATDIGSGETQLAQVISAMALIQTADVEYVGALLTEAEGNHIIHPVQPPVTNGQSDARFTANSITFLEFVFFSTVAKSKVTHRIRGYNSTAVPSLGVFNVNSSGVGDYGNPASPAPLDPGFASYLSSVVANTVDQQYSAISASSRVSVGAKRATRRL